MISFRIIVNLLVATTIHSVGLEETVLHEVDRCPSGQDNWLRRAGEYKCQGINAYHCMKRANGKLVEFCYPPSSIEPGRDGCPWIDQVVTLGHTNTKCKTTVGCPTEDHKGYTTSEIYKYEMCIVPEIPIKPFARKIDNRTDDEGFKIATAMLLFILIASLGTIIILFLINKRKRFIEVKITRSQKRYGGKRTDDAEMEPLRGNHGHMTAHPNRRPIHDFRTTPEDIPAYATSTSAMEHLNKILKKNGDVKNRTVWLCGICGGGKTFTALQFCKKYSKPSFMLRSDDPDVLKDSISKLEEKLNTTLNFYDNDKTPGELLSNVKDPYVFVFDNVKEETAKDVDRLCGILLNVKNSIVLVTTQHEGLFSTSSHFGSKNRVSVNGFTEDESIDFLTEGEPNISEDEKEICRILGNRFANSPFALTFLKSYMRQTEHDFSSILQLYPKSEVSDDLTNTDLLEFFKPLQPLLSSMEKTFPRVFEMFVISRYFKKDDIPVLLLQFVTSKKKANDREYKQDPFLVDDMILLLKKYSLGSVSAKGHKRACSLHSATRIMFSRKVVFEKKSLLDILRAIGWMFCQDFDYKIDRERCYSLRPHAMNAIACIEHLQHIDIPEAVIVIRALKRTAFTCKWLDDQDTYDEYLDEALKYCYIFLLKDKPKYQPFPKFAQLSEVCKKEAKKIYEQLLPFWAQQGIKELAEEYIVNKLRTVSNIRLLEKYLKRPLSRSVQLSESDYSELKKCNARDIVLPSEQLAQVFITELIIDVFHAYGQSFRKDDSDRLRRIYHLMIAFHLAEILHENYKKHPPICAVTTDLLGRIRLIIDCVQSKPNPETGSKQNVLSMAITEAEVAEEVARLNKLMQERKESHHYTYGILIVEEESANLELMHRRQLLRIYSLHSSMAKEANREADKIEDMLASLKRQDALTHVFHSQRAKQILAEYYSGPNESEDKVMKALDVLTNFRHFDPTKDNADLTTMDVRDLELEIKCYKRLKNEKEFNAAVKNARKLKDISKYPGTRHAFGFLDQLGS